MASSPSGTRGHSTTTWATYSRTRLPWRSTFTINPPSPVVIELDVHDTLTDTTRPHRNPNHVLRSGPRPKLTFLSANSSMPPLPSSPPQRQPVHSDADFAHPAHPFALVTNIPLVTMTPANGSTELWLGTHTADVSAQEGAHGDRASGRIREPLLAARAAVRGPSQPTVRKGSIVLRDLRLWHAGMPNSTADVRVMLAMIRFASWYRNPMRLRLAEDVRPLLEAVDGRLEVPVDWISREEALRTYLGRGFGNSYDFDQEQ
ncbi:kanamycin B dioxygenase [Colletotrichum spaethianum]|uniref:Kanamycin B dioxygenase n=1 Tax=Colletotrichum spaethianum TaxID=700344 RepID=A0AA37P1Q5_9PEZI|nr:kanamycin B dioxygenase [Colletotrichum spaethianum]GKT47075.1 kanamycin B dioxygenase [Colletotrichum spaethianum]